MALQPLVSIIIPTYNRAHLLGETLDSVLAQTYPNWECLVVDDGSTDGTAELLNHYIAKDSRFQYHKRPDSHLAGGNGARNYGFELSLGDYIQWFDDDDVMFPTFIKSKMNVIDAGTDLIFCSAMIVDNNLIGDEQFQLNIKEFLFKDYLLWNFQVITNSVLIRRRFLKDKNLFVELLTRGQENEFFSRLFYKLNNNYKIIDAPLFFYRQHEETKTYQHKTYLKKNKASLIYIYEKNLKRAFELKDSKLATFFYFAIIRIYFETFQFDDKSNRKTIAEFLPKLLFLNFKHLEVGFLILGMNFINKSSYKVYQYISTRQINF